MNGPGTEGCQGGRDRDADAAEVNGPGIEMLAQRTRGGSVTMPSQIMSKHGGGVTMPSHGDAGTEGCQELEGFVIKSGTEAEGVRGCSY